MSLSTVNSQIKAKMPKKKNCMLGEKKGAKSSSITLDQRGYEMASDNVRLP